MNVLKLHLQTTIWTLLRAGKRFVARIRVQEPEQFDRLSFLPGEEMQVDFGEGAPTCVPGSDRYRKPRLFVATLRYSCRSFGRVVWNSGQQVWAELHEQAWKYFGGSCRYVVLDNLKEGVLKPDLYEPELNPVYAATLAHDEVEADSEFARYALADADERAGLLKGWVAADLLVLDDLFLARRISEHAAELLQALVHQRYKLRRAAVRTHPLRTWAIDLPKPNTRTKTSKPYQVNHPPNW